VALGGTDPAMLSSPDSRLSRLDKQCEPEDSKLIEAASGGPNLEDLTRVRGGRRARASGASVREGAAAVAG